jgi:hypothetical protein
MKLLVVGGGERKAFWFGEDVLGDLLLPDFDYGFRGCVFFENLTVNDVF